MSISLNVNTANWVAASKTFILNFPSNRSFDGYEIALTNISMYNSFKNISAALQNNVISYTFPAYFTKNPITLVTLATPVNSWTFTFTIPDGYYSVSSLSWYIQSQLYLYKLYVTLASGELVYFTDIAVNTTSYSTQLNLYVVKQTTLSTYTIPTNSAWAFFTASGIGSGTALCPTFSFSLPAFGTLLGLSVGSYGGSIANISQLSTFCPIINPINSLVVGCSLVSNSLCIPSDTCYSFGLTASFGELMLPSIGSPTYLDCKSGSFHSLEVRIYDQNYNVLALYDYEAIFTFNIRKKRQFM